MQEDLGGADNLPNVARFAIEELLLYDTLREIRREDVLQRVRRHGRQRDDECVDCLDGQGNNEATEVTGE